MSLHQNNVFYTFVPFTTERYKDMVECVHVSSSPLFVVMILNIKKKENFQIFTVSFQNVLKSQ